jgi:integrase
MGQDSGFGEDAIYFDHDGPCLDAQRHRGCAGRWRGAVSLGYDPAGKRVRRKVSGRIKQEVKDRLKELHDDLAAGLRLDASYTLGQAVDDWIAEALDGRSAKTVGLYRNLLSPVLEVIGGRHLAELTAHDIRAVLVKLAETRSTRTVSLTHNCLIRAIRHAEANDHVRRNVAALAARPKGQEGRPSRALTVDQAKTVLTAAKGSALHAYVVLSLTTGAQTEELRALRWDHVDMDGGTVALWRSVRLGGETKTRKSRRTLTLSQSAVQALREHRKRQAEDKLAAGPLWQEHGLVFASAVGTPLDHHNVLRSFRAICREAGVGETWTPRELRHSFVSIMSAAGTPVEEIARLAGHTTTATTEQVYRREIRPALTRGAEVMDAVFGGTC